MLKPLLVTSAVLSAAVAAGCGSSSSDLTGGKVTVTSTEYAFAPKVITAKAGKVEITLDNKGAIPHELVVLKTPADPGSLKVGADQRVSEKASVGEVPKIAAGKARSATLDLKPGTYVYVCNIPTHYGDGMRGVLTVK